MEPLTTTTRSSFLRAGIAAATLSSAGCSGGGSSPVAAATPSAAPTLAPTAMPTPMPTGPTTNASIAVDRSTNAGTIGAGFAGLSYEKSMLPTQLFNGANTSLAAIFGLLGTSVLRIGGNSVDTTSWNANAPGAQAGTIAPADVDALAAFLEATGWSAIYGLNLASSSPSAAAAEATYAARKLGKNLLGFEIGNECDLYAGRVRPSTYAYADFVAEWRSYAQAIRAAVPGAPLTGPASAGHATTWTVPFAHDEAGTIALLTQHYYRANGQNASSTIPYLLAGDPALSTELQALAAAARANGVPYRLGEANSYYNGGAPNVSDAYGTALWALDVLFINAQNGSSGINFHGGGNGPGYTPIANSGANVVSVRPEFYGLLLFALAGTGTLRPTTISATGTNASAYAIDRADGTLALVINNKDATTSLAATIALGKNATRIARSLVLAGPSLTATDGVTLGGASIAPSGTWTPAMPSPTPIGGASVSAVTPPGSAILLEIE